MSPAELLARELTAHFLENGNFASAPPMQAAADAIRPAATDGDDEGIEAAVIEHGYAGLEVQGVGCEQGGDRERVHIYVTKGGSKAVRTLEVGDAGVPVEVQVNRIGRIVVRPEQANSATNRGHVYVHRDRVACGSSCAPSGESYSGTFGALVKKVTGEGLYLLSNNHVLAACNHTPVGMPILAPSNADGRPNARGPGEVARHAEICELRSGVPTLVNPCQEDAAIAVVSNPKLVSS